MSELDDLYKRDQVNRSNAKKDVDQIYSWVLIAGLVLSAVCMTIVLG